MTWGRESSDEPHLVGCSVLYMMYNILTLQVYAFGFAEFAWGKRAGKHRRKRAVGHVGSIRAMDQPAELDGTAQRPLRGKALVMSTMLNAVSRRETLSEQVYRELRRSLMEGGLPRQRKMTIRSLAKHLGTSPTPVREAVARLTSEQALVMDPNRSICVPSLETGTLAEIGNIRHDLEGRATVAAASHPSDARTLALSRCLARARDAAGAGDGRASTAAYVDLHFLIYRSGGSSVLLSLIERLWSQMAPYLPDVFADPRLAQRNLSRHMALMAALEAGDVEGGRDAIHRCIDWQMSRAMEAARREAETDVLPPLRPAGVDRAKAVAQLAGPLVL